MKIELAQIITLISHGNKILSLGGKRLKEPLSYYSTLSNVSRLSFLASKTSEAVEGETQIIAKSVTSWFSYLEANDVKYLKLDLMNLNELSLLMPQVS
jgi:hypothetical protein